MPIWEEANIKKEKGKLETCVTQLLTYNIEPCTGKVVFERASELE